MNMCSHDNDNDHNQRKPDSRNLVKKNHNRINKKRGKVFSFKRVKIDLDISFFFYYR